MMEVEISGKGPTIVLRRHESADLPGENPEAWRYQVLLTNGLIASGVGRSFEIAAKAALELVNAQNPTERNAP